MATICGLLAASLLSCVDSSSGPPTPDAGSADAAPAPSPVWLPTGDVLTWAEVRDSLSLLETIAGASLADTGNEWLSSFEGGSATEAELSRPHMAMADAEGNVFIADKEAHGVRRIDLDGNIHTVAGTNVVGDAPDEPTPATLGALSNPNGLWVQPDGTFYVLDLGNAKIRKVTPEGEMSTLIAMDSLPVGRGLWVAPDESEVLIAAGSEVRRWTPESGSEVVAGGFASLGMVLRSPDGRILVGDRAGHRVYSVGADGTTTPIAGTGTSGPFQQGARALETPLDEPRAIWPHGGGLFIGLHNGRRVLYVDAEGITHLILQGSGDTHAGDGEPWDSPGDKIGELRSLSVSAQEDLIIVENDAGFVRVLRGGA